jgi:hypothetical protein
MHTQKNIQNKNVSNSSYLTIFKIIKMQRVVTNNLKINDLKTCRWKSDIYAENLIKAIVRPDVNKVELTRTNAKNSSVEKGTL